MSSSGSDFWSDEIDWSDEHEVESSEIVSNELVIAASEGLVDKLNFLIGSGHDAKDKFGAAALLGAAANGHAVVVTSLLEAGAPIEARSSYRTSYRTPLINAAHGDHVKVVDLLLAAGANIKAVDMHGYSALCVAAHNPTKEVAKFLL